MSDIDPRAEDWPDAAEESGGDVPWDSGARPDEVDEADAAEQSIDVGVDDDDYR